MDRSQEINDLSVRVQFNQGRTLIIGCRAGNFPEKLTGNPRFLFWDKDQTDRAKITVPSDALLILLTRFVDHKVTDQIRSGLPPGAYMHPRWLSIGQIKAILDPPPTIEKALGPRGEPEREEYENLYSKLRIKFNPNVLPEDQIGPLQREARRLGAEIPRKRLLTWLRQEYVGARLAMVAREKEEAARNQLLKTIHSEPTKPPETEARTGPEAERREKYSVALGLEAVSQRMVIGEEERRKMLEVLEAISVTVAKFRGRLEDLISERRALSEYISKAANAIGFTVRENETLHEEVKILRAELKGLRRGQLSGGSTT